MFIIRIRQQPTDPEQFYTGYGWSRRRDQAYEYATEAEAETALRSVCLIDRIKVTEPAE